MITLLPKQVEQTKDEIDAQKEAALAAGFTYNGTLYHCDAVFQQQITSYVTGFNSGLIPPDATVPVRSRANVTELMTHAQLMPFAGALMAHVQGIYAAAWAAKDAL